MVGTYAQATVEERHAVIIAHPRELDLRHLLLSPLCRPGSAERLVVSKLGLEMAIAEGFHQVLGQDGESVQEEIRFEVRLNDTLRRFIGPLAGFYGKFWQSSVVIQSRFDESGAFGVSATVTPHGHPDASEVLNARVERLRDGAYTFTLTDARWRGQSVTLDPQRGTVTVTGVLHPTHQLSGRYALRRHRFF